MAIDLEQPDVLFAIAATYAVGARVISEAARIDGLHLICPEVETEFEFELNGVTFRAVLSVAKDDD